MAGKTNLSLSYCIGQKLSCLDHHFNIEYAEGFDNPLFSIHFKSLFKSFVPLFKKNKILGYCVERILSLSKVHDPFLWTLKKDDNEQYYLSFDEKILEKVISQLKIIENIPDIDRVKSVLTFEYGYLLPGLEKLSIIEKVKINTDDAPLTNEFYGRNLNHNLIDLYKDHEFPRGIFTKVHNVYKLIDGYHRIASAKEYKLPRIEILVMR